MTPYSRKAWLAMVVFALMSIVGTGSVSAIESCDFGEDVPTTRPNPEAGPTKVRLALFIFDLVDVDTVKQEFTLDFFLEGEWKDQRLGEILRKSGVRTCETSLDDVWRPSTIIVNLRALRLDLPEVLYVHANGTVEGEQRVIGTFAAHFNLTDFPKDTQTLPITWISTKHGPEELEYVFEGHGAEEVFSESGWSVRRARAQSGVYEMELLRGPKGEETERLARLDYEIEVTRRANYYVWKVFMPICLIVFISWAIFWIDPTQLAVQTSVGTAMMLTIIAFLFSLQNILPKISYLTRMDIFVYSALIFVFLAFAEALMTCTVAAHGREVVARRIDLWSRWVFPSAFAAVIVWFWLG